MSGLRPRRKKPTRHTGQESGGLRGPPGPTGGCLTAPGGGGGLRRQARKPVARGGRPLRGLNGGNGADLTAPRARQEADARSAGWTATAAGRAIGGIGNPFLYHMFDEMSSPRAPKTVGESLATHWLFLGESLAHPWPRHRAPRLSRRSPCPQPAPGGPARARSPAAAGRCHTAGGASCAHTQCRSPRTGPASPASAPP